MKTRLTILTVSLGLALGAVVLATKPTPESLEPNVVHRVVVKNPWPEPGPPVIRFRIVVRSNGGPPDAVSTPANWRALPPGYEDSSDTWEIPIEAVSGAVIRAGSSQGPFLVPARKDGLIACDFEFSDGSSLRAIGCPSEVEE
jgi:hypothetical protein